MAARDTSRTSARREFPYNRGTSIESPVQGISATPVSQTAPSTTFKLGTFSAAGCAPFGGLIVDERVLAFNALSDFLRREQLDLVLRWFNAVGARCVGESISPCCSGLRMRCVMGGTRRLPR